MRSFLLKEKSPICKWGLIPEEIYFKGDVPEGYSLAISPTPGIVVLDVDVNTTKNGFDHIPPIILEELERTLNYPTKRNGRHFWIKYTGNLPLLNRSTQFGLDLRTHKGYVRWYLPGDIRDHIDSIKESSENLKNYLENLFYYPPKISINNEHTEK